MKEAVDENSLIDIRLSKREILMDYQLACESRAVSLLGRKDVFMGRAKFGIFGDGKEVAQLALCKAFKKGDFRSGYYRDQTIIAAQGELTWQQLFAQLYAHADLNHDIFSGGRSMNAHYGNRWVDANGEWLNQTQMYNHVMDVSSTAGQIPRAVGLGYASKLYRENEQLGQISQNFSQNGNEICFATIGDASTSQGMFFEAINAAGVLQIPVIFSVWDDGYGISVPKKYQTTKESISEILRGFERNEQIKGFEIIEVKGHDYIGLIQAYKKAETLAREQHIPCLVHVIELTQPQGHSTSGSHERYKDEDRLQWENTYDCNARFKNWIIENEVATVDELNVIENEANKVAKQARKDAWDAVREDIDSINKKGLQLLNQLIVTSKQKTRLIQLRKSFAKIQYPLIKDSFSLLKQACRIVRNESSKELEAIKEWVRKVEEKNFQRYSTHLYSQSTHAPLTYNGTENKSIPATYTSEPNLVEGRTIINKYFEQLFESRPEVFAIGEDVGKIGDVNQGFAGLQEKFGELRITDTGIREATIIGQGIGAAMRGLRPIVEVQYFDYIYYCLATLTDDLACLRYRTMGQQKAPLIVRTRGHRLEGIWHSGSPLAVIINALRGMHVLVPRNFVQAAAMYNTILDGDDPALIIEPLNSYRRKEKMPDNLDSMKLALGEVDYLKRGKDITIVTYGSMCQIVMEAAKELEELKIDVEVIDVQSLLPFDLGKEILTSLQKTNRIIFADEDMPGGTTAYMMQKVIDDFGGYRYLDSPARCISAKEHRPPYGSDGDYFSKPNKDSIIDVAYEIMHESNPKEYPSYLS